MGGCMEEEEEEEEKEEEDELVLAIGCVRCGQ